MSASVVQPADLSRDLVDLAAVSRWLAGQGLPAGPITDVRRIGGGTQNMVLHLRWAGQDVVLRRPPEHPRPSSNAALRREIRVLGALAGTDVPHPELIAACENETVLGGVVFYLMAEVDGINPGDALAEPYVSDAAARYTAGLDVAGALARLAAVGLGDVGRPDGFLERQVPQWLRHLESYAALPGYPGGRLPHVAELAEWLTAHRPPMSRPGLVHGDYQLNNVLLARTEARVAAIVDWEMCTVGDPLLDLGWLLVTWPEDAGALAGGPLAAAGGLPDAAALVDRYADGSDRDLTAVDWYTVLAGFKLAVVIEGTHARARAGQADAATGDWLHGAAVDLLDRAAAVAGI